MLRFSSYAAFYTGWSLPNLLVTHVPKTVHCLRRTVAGKGDVLGGGFNESIVIGMIPLLSSDNDSDSQYSKNLSYLEKLDSSAPRPALSLPEACSTSFFTNACDYWNSIGYLIKSCGHFAWPQGVTCGENQGVCGGLWNLFLRHVTEGISRAVVGILLITVQKMSQMRDKRGDSWRV